MRFDNLLTYTELVRDDLSVLRRGSDDRYYVSDADYPERWHTSCDDFACAMRSFNFAREFWTEKLEPSYRDHPTTARIDGVHYRIGREDDRSVRGYGGSLFLIEFNDDRRVATHNLWCQGTIPKALLQHLPDNARFVPHSDLDKYHVADDPPGQQMMIDRWLEDVYTEELGNDGAPMPRNLNEDDPRKER